MPPVTRRDGLARAAARQARPRHEAELPGHDDALRVFLSAIGGREAFTEVLTVAGSDPAVQKILKLLLDPRHDGESLTHLCRLAGLTVADFFVAYRKGTLAKAQIIATVLIANKVCAVVEDVMTRAAPHEVPCTTCRGTGQVLPRPTISTPTPEPAPCHPCRATGTIPVLPTLDRQKVALELAQLTHKSGGIFVQQNSGAVATASASAPTTPAATAPISGALEQLQQAVSQILYSGGPMTTLDVEPVPRTAARSATPAELPDDPPEPPADPDPA